MKKLILLVLALSLCFMIGCKEAKEPIKEIENTEVPKIEEPITEPKIEEPIEETPVEPEAEEPVAEKPEVAEPVEEIDENVIILPEPDENTKVIKIEFPEDFPPEPYTESELVSPEEFEWGEYVPLVKILGIEHFMTEAYISTYAILSPTAKDLDQAREVYSNLNNKYLTQSPFNDYLIHDGKLSDYPEISDFLYSSHITHTSEDLSKIFRLSYLESGGSEENLIWYARNWKTKNEIIENGEVIKSVIYDDIISVKPFNSNETTYFKQGKQINVDFKEYYYLHADGYSKYQLYSLDEAKLLCEIRLPKSCYVSDYGKDYLLLDFYDDNSNPATYLYDLEKEEFTYVEHFAYNSKISPDKKYVAFTSADYEAPPQHQKNKNGFYIKNLENNTTVFYPYIYENYRCLYIQNWIKKDCLF